MDEGNALKVKVKVPNKKAALSSPKNVIKTTPKRICVIITNKKNSSWIDDLDARDKLNSANRVYH